MDRVVSIPKRVFGLILKEELTPLSVDVFVSIPKRGYLPAFLFPRLLSVPKLLQVYDLFDKLNKSMT